MIFWALLTGLLFGTLWAEAWIWLRDNANSRRHANPQPKHTFAEWLARKPVDLDQQDRAGKR